MKKKEGKGRNEEKEEMKKKEEKKEKEEKEKNLSLGVIKKFITEGFGSDLTRKEI